MKRCHNCLRKIADANPASTINKWGKECCDTCTTCEHGVPLINPDCAGCTDLIELLFVSQFSDVAAGQPLLSR